MLLFIIFAGTPPMVILGVKKDLVTTDPAAIAMLSAIYISPYIFTPGPQNTLSPILGAFPGSILIPILTP